MSDSIKQALSRFKRFSGHDGKVIGRANPAKTRGVLTTGKRHVLIAIGSLDFVGYTTKRDGRVESYIHRFVSSARPLLAVSHDGRSLYVLGGDYRFTARGIVDRRRIRRK